MRKSIVLALTLLAAATSLHAADPKPKVLSGLVHFSRSDTGPQGYMSMKEGATDSRPALILVQEWWGLTDWIKQDADRYAAMGYVVVAPDLYRGKLAADADEAHQLMRGLPEDRALGDLKSAFEYLATRPDVDPKRIGVVGWCMGGGYALTLGIEEPRLAAVVINYGRLVTDPAVIAKIKPAVQGNFGATDKGIPVEDVKAFEKTLKTTNRSVDFMIFDGAGHGFMNPNNKTGFVAGAADKAWARMDAFLAKNLGNK